MKVLSKYTKTQSLVNRDATTQKEYIDYLKTNNKKEAPDDLIRPYTYREWSEKNYGLISGDEFKQYDDYLKKWYENVFLPSDSTRNLKESYISFLKELALVLNQDGNSSELANIDYTSDFDVQNSIPFFAKKLKQICLYLITKREALKKAKLKYNTYGSIGGLERVLYEYLLKAFTKRGNYQSINDNDVLDTILPLSSVKDNFAIFVEDIYDDTWYLNGRETDSSNLSFSNEITSVYDTLGISPSTYNWIFNTGYFQICADNPLFWTFSNIVLNDLPLSAFDLEDSNNLIEYMKFKLSEKYLGTNLYYITGGFYETKIDTYQNNLVAGNNWFFFPSGDYFSPTFYDYPTDSILLSATSLSADGATGSKNYLNSDKIFIHYGNTVEGAWLKSVFNSYVDDYMKGLLEKRSYYEFKFPFIGYGLSGNNFEWTGKQISNLNKDFNYYDSDMKGSVLSAYWTDTSNISSVRNISLQRTSLIEDGATPNEIFEGSDHIMVETTDEFGDSTREYAWLYKSDKTDLPIRRGQNFINWPLYRYEVNSPTLYKILSSQCDSIPLSVLTDHIGQRAGYGLHDSDLIYKLGNYNGIPYECAFLSGAELKGLGGTTFTANATGIIQPSLSLRCNPDNFVTFIWTDDDTPLSAVNIKYTPHQPDCQYLKQDLFSLYDENPSDDKDIDYSVWKKCDCKAIVYSPLGHMGENYDDYAGFSDIIFLDTSYPTPFSFNTWKDLDGRDYKQSADFAWYQLTGYKPELGPVGYGEGRWVAGNTYNNSNNFVFRKGYQYKILRSGLKYDSSFIAQNYLPPLIVKYRYNNSPPTKWVKATLNNSSNWVESLSTSDMILSPSDYVMYDHIDSNWYCITSTGTEGTGFLSSVSAYNLSGGIWQNYDYVTSGVKVTLLWPDTVVTGGPSLLSYQLTSVTWKITPPTGSDQIYHLYSPDSPLYIYTDKVGIWTVSAIGYNQISEVSANDIAKIEVAYNNTTPQITGSKEVKTIYADTINFQIVEPLSGWDYDNHQFSTDTIRPSGMRPFWAYATDNPTRETKFKGIGLYGGNISVYDEYTLISQPLPTDIILKTNDKIGYYSANEFIWSQPLQFINLTNNLTWCKLILSANAISNLSDYIYNNPMELIVSAVDIESDISLSPVKDGYPVLVNYWAENSFTWNQTLTSSSLGIAPTGGNYTPLSSGVLIEASLPHLNILSNYSPSIASIPRLDNFYTRRDKGGYFLPKGLGIRTFISRGHKNVLDIIQSSENRNLSGVFLSLDTYGKNIANNQITSVIPVSTLKFDSEWMKSRSNEYYRAGMVKNASTNPTFIPYQSNYESKSQNSFGLSQQGDTYDPWYGELDNEWESIQYWPSNFRGEDQIDNWYESKSKSWLDHSFPYTWKSDIFGNQYILVKQYLNNSNISNKRDLFGNIYIRDQRNIVDTIENSLSSNMEILSSDTESRDLFNQIVSGGVKEMDIWFDTIYIETSGYIFTDKLIYDFNTGNFNSDITNQHIIDLSANSGGKNVGHWFFDEEKKVVIVHGLSSDGIFTPYFNTLDLNTNVLTPLNFTSESYTILNNLSSIELDDIEDLKLTYDKFSKTYNIAFINNHSVSGMFIGLINISDLVNTLNVQSLVCISPINTL